MGKFAIECPKCGSINQASTFIFAKKVIKCGACGEEIDTKKARLTSKVCPGCGNVVVCDQAKLKGKKCPVCGKELSPLSATAEYKIATVNCPQCACAVEVDKTKEIGKCPICDCEFNIKKELAKAGLTNDTGVSVIQYEGNNDTFIWKHPIEDFNLGSQLIVHESQEAIFFLNGEALDTFGPGRHTLETENIPILKKIYALPTGHQTPFHAEVYFVNKAVQMGIKWGTDSRVRFVEPATGLPLDIGASGEMNLKIENSRKALLKLVGTMKGIDWEGRGDGFTKSLQAAFRAPIVTEIKTYLANVLSQQKINILEIDAHLGEFSEALREKISPRFEEYGLSIPQFYVTTVSLPEDDKNFKDYKALISQAYIGVRTEEVKADIALAEQKRRIIEAQTQAQLDMIKAQGQAESSKLAGFAEAEVMHAKGYSHKDEIEADVQKAYAAGMGQFGANGGNSSGGGASSEMVNLMMGMKMAGVMGDKFDSIMSPTSPRAAQTTAPVSGWSCSCGETNITSKFCPNCGKPQAPSRPTWNCSCGTKNITSKFCPDCGAPCPVASTWDCACGAKNITSKFCPDCGSAKPNN